MDIPTTKTMSRPDDKHGTIYVFQCDHGRLQTVKADWNAVLQAQEKWEETLPKPTPPLIPITPNSKHFSVKLARKAVQVAKRDGVDIDEAEAIVCAQADPVEDTEDEGYLEQLNRWKWTKFLATERHLFQHYLLYDTETEPMTLQEIVAIEDKIEEFVHSPTQELLKTICSDKVRFELYKHFMRTSILTYELVLESARIMGVTRGGKPILEVVPKVGSEAQPIEGIGIMAAIDLGVDPDEFKRWTIGRQSNMVAAVLVKKWLQYFANKDAQRDAAVNHAYDI